MLRRRDCGTRTRYGQVPLRQPPFRSQQMQALQWHASNWFVPQLPGSGQELPHAPQLFGSPVMSVQVP